MLNHKVKAFKRHWVLVLLGLLVFTGLMRNNVQAATDESDTLSPPMTLGSASQQIPQGVQLKIKMITPVSSQTANVGDSFLAEASEDLWSRGDSQQSDVLLIPKGTVIRGQVLTVQRPGFFSKGGLLRLNFDHAVMPTGELKPIGLQMDAASAKMNAARNALYTDPGVGVKLNKSVDKGVHEFQKMQEKGVQTGKAMGGGLNMLLTVPATTVAGVATGTAVTTVGAAKAVFGKGTVVSLQPGDELLLDFSQPTTLEGQ